MATHSEFTVAAGERVPFVLTWHPSWQRPPEAGRPVPGGRRHRGVLGRVDVQGDATTGAGRARSRRSLVVLKALTFQPTGGIVAAATTSLPEQLGGPRNWDYRYCWLRDAALTLQALLGAGFKAEAGKWRDWLLRAVAGDPADLQIMYGLDGTRRLPEFELDWLPGYEGSRPVRIGNAAADQLQLDVWGETHRRPRVRPGGPAVPQRRGLGAAGQPAGVPGGQLAGAGQRAVGDARPAPALRALQGDGLGRVRPDDHRRGALQARRPGGPVAARSGTRSSTRSANGLRRRTGTPSPRRTGRPSWTRRCC